MKGITLAVIIALGASFSVPAMAADDCKRALCMFGLLMGENDSTCSSAISSYFDIQVWKKGKIKWSQTASKRMSALNSCPGADPDKMKNVNDKFGKLWGA